MSETTNETKKPTNGGGFLVPLAIVIAGMVVAGAILLKGSPLVEKWAAKTESKESLPVGGQEETGEEASPSGTVAGEESQAEPKPTVGNFSVFEDREICKEDGKPVVYYFGSESCPHCRWEEPIVKEVAAQFSDLIAFHNNMDSQNDAEVMGSYRDFNPGYIPFLVFGCKYARTGSGESAGEEAEKKNLTALICKLTNNQPAGVCSSVQDLTREIEK